VVNPNLLPDRVGSARRDHHLPPRERTPELRRRIRERQGIVRPPWGPGTAIAGFVIADVVEEAVALLLWLLGVGFGLVAGATLVEAVSLGVALVLARRAAGSVRAADFGLRRTAPRAAVGWVLLALFGGGMVLSVYDSIVAPRPERIFEHVSAHPLAGVIAGGVSAALLAPLAEELFYRGFLYGGLRRRLGPMAAVVITSLLFALDHLIGGGYTLADVGAVAIIGVSLCLLYEITGSIWPCVALHSFYDASSFELSRGGGGGVVAAIAALIALFFLAYPTLARLGRSLR
jgi:CAAX protease family protein